jgi:hypothetical protein
VNALAVNGTKVFAGTDNGIFLSTNNGTSWTKTSNGLTSSNVYSLAMSGTNILAGTFNGIFLSTNNGTNWNSVNIGLTSAWVYALSVNGANVFAGTSKGVVVSTDNGASWTQKNSGLTDTYINALAVSGPNILAGTDNGVFLSKNSGANWTQINTGLAGIKVSALAIVGADVLAGIKNMGVWKRSLAEVTPVEKNVTELPITYSLAQNYPNPFNPSTTIRYELPKESFVSLKVVNLLGENVATLYEGTRKAGIFTVQCNASRLASGVYFYRLQARPTDGGQAGEFVETKSMIYVK